MNVSASLNAFYDPAYKVPAAEQLVRLYDGGFRYLDMNFWDWSRGDASPFLADNWEDWVKGIGEKADSLGVVFTQAHANVYNFYQDPGDAALYETYVRSIKGAALLNIPWVTFHTSFNSELSEEQMKKDNIEFYKPLAELAAKYNTGIALENMPSRYPENAESLIEMVDPLTAYGTVGVCWDTGHAHISHLNQGEELRRLGSRLHALHIQDNDGVSDHHMPPFFGTIDWHDVMDALHEIDYKGDFTFEAHMIVRRLPEWCKHDGVKTMFDIGEALVNGRF